jgi:RNA polymerase sigma-70 factor (ECF subfamily)
MNFTEEKSLVEKAKKDVMSFGELYDAYYPRILKYVVRRVADVRVGRDITSEVFFKALKHLHTFTWRDVSFSSWLYKIANNEIYTYYRSLKYTPSLDAYDDIADKQNIEKELIEAEEALQEQTQFLEIQKHIAALDIKYQEVIHLRYFEKKKIGEIAEILGKNENTIKSLLSRAIDRLKSKCNF